MATSGNHAASQQGTGPHGSSGGQKSLDPVMERYWAGGKFSLVDLPLLIMTCAIVTGALIICISFIILAIIRKCRECREKRVKEEIPDEIHRGEKRESVRKTMTTMLMALQGKKKFSHLDDSKEGEMEEHEVKEDPLQFEKRTAILTPYILSDLDEEMEAQPAPLVAASGLMALPRKDSDQGPDTATAQVVLPEERDEPDSVVPKYGRLWFSIVYNEVSQKLFIRVIKAKYLKPRDKSNPVRDPFVKVFLLPDEFNIQEAKLTDNTCAPHFDQTLEFTNIRPSVIKLKTVRISVYDMDSRRVRHAHGHVILPLAGYDVASGVVIWRDLEPDENLPTAVTCGELNVILTHEPQSQTLVLSLAQGRNMNNAEYYGRGHSVHIQLKLGDRIVQNMTTQCRPFSSSIQYDADRFVLSIPFDQLKACSLSLLVCIEPTDEGSYSDKRSIGEVEQREAGLEIGRLVLGLETYSCGSGVEHWQYVMENPGKVSDRWHNVLSSIQLHTP